MKLYTDNFNTTRPIGGGGGGGERRRYIRISTYKLTFMSQVVVT